MIYPVARGIVLFLALMARPGFISLPSRAAQNTAGRRVNCKIFLVHRYVPVQILSLRRAPEIAHDHAEQGGWRKKGLFAASFAQSPSGSRLAVSGSDGVIRLINSEDGTILLSHDQHLTTPDHNGFIGFMNSAVFSYDGLTIASPCAEGAVELWDVASNRTIRRLKFSEKHPSGKIQFILNPTPVCFSPDGCLLGVLTPEGKSLTLFDAATGEPRLSLPLESENNIFMPSIPLPAAFAPDSRMLATSFHSEKITLWDLRSGKTIREFTGQRGCVVGIAISADGRTLASCTGHWGGRVSKVVGQDFGDHTIRLWDMATGRTLLTILGHTDNVTAVVFTPDGRSLLSASEDKTVRLWETATGKELDRWSFDEIAHFELAKQEDAKQGAKQSFNWETPDIAVQLAISPDGRKAAARLVSGAITLFPIDPPQSDKSRSPFDAKTFARLWDALGDADAAKAYAAVCTLSQPSPPVPSWIGKRLRPVPRVGPDDLARLIADLDADAFDRREAATKALAALGAQAGPALRETLDETPSPEVRSRVKPLLKALDEWVVTDPDTLRALRAIWVLERVGTPEARAVLVDLAKGAPEVRQTQEAKSALDFLDKRAAARPDHEAKP